MEDIKTNQTNIEKSQTVVQKSSGSEILAQNLLDEEKKLISSPELTLKDPF